VVGGLASRYARAFAEVAEASGLAPAAAQQQLQDFADTLGGSAELRDLLGSPAIPTAQKVKVLDALAPRMGLVRPVRNFLAVILEHQRLSDLDEIRTEYRELADQHAGAVEATITSARPLDRETRAELEAQIAKLAGAGVRATYQEDPGLLGGAVVQIGSTVYDGSIRAQLGNLRHRLVSA
jgi:F-type H+-transporting ATPase subunit delta